jgi:hypothetical protein
MLFGAALGIVVREVPLDVIGYFFEPLWTKFLLAEEIAGTAVYLASRGSDFVTGAAI